jgi:hypothetical protein
MNKKNILQLLLIIIFFNLLLVIISASRLYSINIEKQSPTVLGIASDNEIIISNENSILQSSYLTAEYQDYRAFVLDAYFQKYNSPLEGYGTDFIVACDKYGLSKDCTVIPAIAYAETGLCTLGISAKQFNCWGFGGSDTNRIVFKNYSEAIDIVTQRLASGYGRALLDPVAMAHVYCGANCVNWGEGVNNQRNEIKKLARDLNLPNID